MKSEPFKDSQALSLTPGAQVPVNNRNPAVGYLASLKTKDGRRVQLQALASVASLLSDDLPEPLPGEKVEAHQRRAVESIAWHEIDNTMLQFIATKLNEAHSPKTANRKLAAVRRVLKQAWRNDLLTREQYEKAVDVQDVQGSRERKGRDIQGEEIEKLFDSCRKDLANPEANHILAHRDNAIIALLCGGGLRRAEACSLTLACWDAAKGKVRVIGKNNEERTVYLAKGTCLAIKRWLAVRGTAPGPLLCPVLRGGHIVFRQMNPQTIWDAIARRATAAGVAKLTPHDFRRTFIGDLLDSGADLSTAQKIVGHKDSNTTAGYDRRPEEVQRAAVNRLHVPFY